MELQLKLIGLRNEKPKFWKSSQRQKERAHWQIQILSATFCSKCFDNISTNSIDDKLMIKFNS